MSNGEAVDNLEITVRFAIRQWGVGSDGYMYDWLDSSGNRSEELFDTVQEAIDDIKGRY